ncbi:hypothetical protein DRO32_04830 [Candidatus Bathyarchaeota archaeon]|nr:MAG: hypothetical protein DRO32_04830 [Candidatus Bathyarchaeota archaeon]
MSGAEVEERDGELVIRVGDKEVVINEETLEVLQEYARTEMTLEQLARRLGLRNWMDAFELVKAVPGWVLWTPPAFWRTQAGRGGRGRG